MTSAPNERLFVMRLQQYTGPVMAKGLEDTAFYRYYPLASLNEVGGNPQRFGISRDNFHAKNSARRNQWPNSLLATSTHDSKRSEDVRARINVLSEIPAEWYRALRSWQRKNRDSKVDLAGVETPSANAEYLLYQTLLGAWPLTPMGPQEHEEFVARIQEYMEKALREAKIYTSWVSPNAAYETIVRNFIKTILEPMPENEFLREFISFPQQDRAGGNAQFFVAGPVKDCISGHPRFLSGKRDLELQPGGSRQPPPCRLFTAPLSSREVWMLKPGGSGRACCTTDEPSCEWRYQVVCDQPSAQISQGQPGNLLAWRLICPCALRESLQNHIVAFART